MFLLDLRIRCLNGPKGPEYRVYGINAVAVAVMFHTFYISVYSPTGYVLGFKALPDHVPGRPSMKHFSGMESTMEGPTLRCRSPS